MASQFFQYQIGEAQGKAAEQVALLSSLLPIPVVGFGVSSMGGKLLATAKLGKATRVFWSGGKQAKMAAEKFAKANAGKTLEMTLQGKTLTKLTDLTSYKLTQPLWKLASSSFARGAKGPVNVFHNANSGVRLKSVWRTTEYPILKNKNEIIYHNVFK